MNEYYSLLLGGMLGSPSILILGIIAALLPMLINSLRKDKDHDEYSVGSGQNIILISGAVFFVISMLFHGFMAINGAKAIGEFAMNIPSFQNMINSILNLCILFGIFRIINGYR